MWVVEQALVALTPWESLGANAQVVVLDEWWTLVVVLLLVFQVGVQHAEGDCGSSHEEGETLPQLPATFWSNNLGGEKWHDVYYITNFKYVTFFEIVEKNTYLHVLQRWPMGRRPLTPAARMSPYNGGETYSEALPCYWIEFFTNLNQPRNENF